MSYNGITHKAVIEKQDCGCQIVDSIKVPHCDCLTHGGRIEVVDRDPLQNKGSQSTTWYNLC